jgi:hypothetical protein
MIINWSVAVSRAKEGLKVVRVLKEVLKLFFNN